MRSRIWTLIALLVIMACQPAAAAPLRIPTFVPMAGVEAPLLMTMSWPISALLAYVVSRLLGVALASLLSTRTL